MVVSESALVYWFEVGEEVVVRPGEGYAVRVGGSGATVTEMPTWTIGVITARFHDVSGAMYDIEFRMFDDVYACRVSESAIEGTA